MRHYSVMVLRSLCVVFTLVLAGSAGTVYAQAIPVPVADDTPNTGDTWIDGRLKDINSYARRYPDSFVDELARYANVRRGYVQALLEQHHWQPGDLYFACAWASSMNLSCREVVRGWSRDHHDGWKGVIARLPIAPDNLHYRAVRHAIVASYDRWDRPIPLDARLLDQLGDRVQRRARAQEAARAAEAAEQARL